MRSPTPHRRPASRVVVAGLATALALGACGAADDVDAVAGLQIADGDLDTSGASLESTVPVSTALAGSDPAPAEGQLPGLPVASGQAEVTQVTRPSGDTASTGSTVATTTPTMLTTSTSPTTQPPTTAQATTAQPQAANLPTNAVLDLASGSNVSFSQAAQGNSLPVLLWFWSPN